MKRLIAVLALGVALAGCDFPGQQSAGPADRPELGGKIERKLCGHIAQAQVQEALGSSIAEITEETSSPHPGCTWLGERTPDGPRILSIYVYRKAALEGEGAPLVGKDFYLDQAAAIEAEYTRAGSVPEIGEEAVMALTPLPSGYIDGAIVSRVGDDVMVVNFKGPDPSAFEAIAGEIARNI
jgi:hypothetical protein